MSDDTPKLPAVRIQAQGLATRASHDEEILLSWLDSLTSAHTKRNFETTARAFLANLPAGLRNSSVEDVRDAIAAITMSSAPTTARQYVLRVKSLLTYSHRLGYTTFNAGTVIRVKSDNVSRGARLAKRIISEVQVGLLVRAAQNRRHRIMLEVLYAGGLRVSELTGLTWADVITRDHDQVQLAIIGKGGVERQVLLPPIVSKSVLSLRQGAPAASPVFANQRTGEPLTERAVRAAMKRAAKAAGIEQPVSPHWLRHAHASHAIDKGATLPEVQETLGHASITTTSGYLHARPGTSSGLRLDQGVFLR